jgi:anti-anti-sigma regulatory factor
MRPTEEGAVRTTARWSWDVCVLTVGGEADLCTAPRSRRDLEEAMAVTPGDVVLDLTDLELVASTATGS